VFNIGMMELLVVLLVAFLVVGPKDLPKVARWIARMIKKARVMVESVKDELGLDELTADVNEVKSQVEGTLRDADVTAEMRAAQDELRAAAEGLDYEVRRTASDVKEAVEK